MCPDHLPCLTLKRCSAHSRCSVKICCPHKKLQSSSFQTMLRGVGKKESMTFHRGELRGAGIGGGVADILSESLQFYVF